MYPAIVECHNMVSAQVESGMIHAEWIEVGDLPEAAFALAVKPTANRAFVVMSNESNGKRPVETALATGQ